MRSMPRWARSSPTIMFDGPLDTLTLTENAQPALMAVSLAVMRVLEQREGLSPRRQGQVRRRPFAGRIFRACGGRRAQRCRRSAPPEDARARPCRRPCRSARAPWRRCWASARTSAEKLAAEAAQGEVCQLANDNEPTQAVHLRRQDRDRPRRRQLAKAHGVRRFMPLNVSAPFHCALMQPAADAMAEALGQGRRSRRPPCPLIANVLAAPISDPGRDQAAPRRAGHRHRALARMRRAHGRRRRHRHLRDRLRQGAGRARQAHRADAQRHLASAHRRTSTPRCRAHRR